jgi:hypothetical protein
MSQQTTIKNELFRFVTVTNIIDIPESNSNSNAITAPQAAIDELPANQSAAKSAFETYVKPFATAKEVRSINADLYDFATTIYAKRKRNATFSLEKSDIKTLSAEEETEIWKQLFFYTITAQSKAVCSACTLMLLGDFVLKNANKESTEAELKVLAHTKVIIPNEVVALRQEMLRVRCDNGKMMGVTKLGYAEYMRVEQELCCYVPGEVSHIENIMAKEYKERSTRNLTRSEISTEYSTETEVENLSDTTSTSRHELHNEITQVLEEQIAFNANVAGSVSYSPPVAGAGPSYSVNAYVGVDTNNNSSFTDNTAETFAEETTRRALERIVRKTSEKRTSKMIREFEENQKHGYDNTKGDGHITGVYRWIDKIYTNRLINYGKCLIFEFSVPEPAKWYREAMLWKPATAVANAPAAPVKPKTLVEKGITTFANITRANYADLAAYYGATIPTPQVEFMQEPKNLSHTPGDPTSDPQTFTHTIQPVADYDLISLNGSYSTSHHIYYIALGAHYRLTGHIYIDGPGGNFIQQTMDNDVSGNFSRVFWEAPTNPPTPGAPNNPIAGAINFDTNTHEVNSYVMSVIFKYRLKPAKFVDWQTQAYAKLEQGYASLLAAYNSALFEQQQNAAQETSDIEKTQTNPAFNRITEQRELKRACIEMLAKPCCHKVGQNLFDTDTCLCPTDDNKTATQSFPSIKQDQELQNYSEYVRFFEQAFEWNIISYTYHPYYWADKCRWAELMQSQNDDTIFQGFLQSGMARVTVTVRPEYTEKVLYYLQMGHIDMDTSETVLEMYQIIVKELWAAQTDGPQQVGSTWETRVPSTLTIIQDGTAGLDANGLPCCKDIDPEHPVSIGTLYGNKKRTMRSAADGAIVTTPPATKSTVKKA